MDVPRKRGLETEGQPERRRTSDLSCRTKGQEYDSDYFGVLQTDDRIDRDLVVDRGLVVGRWVIWKVTETIRLPNGHILGYVTFVIIT